MWLANILIAVVIAITVGSATAAEPPVRLSEDGAVILYRAQPGDMPGTIAERFGIAPADVPAFLAANGITDPSRLAAGHLFRVPNPHAERASAAEARAATLAAERDEARIEARALADQVTTLTARSEDLAARSASLERLARLWPWLQALGVVLVIALAAAVWFAYQSGHRSSDAERYTRGLTDQLDERRRAALAERQASARRILSLEEQVQTLERELTPLRTVHRRPTGTH